MAQVILTKQDTEWFQGWYNWKRQQGKLSDVKVRMTWDERFTSWANDVLTTEELGAIASA